MKKILFILACSVTGAAALVGCGSGTTGVDAAKSQLTIDSTVNAKLATMKTMLDAKCQARVDSAATAMLDSLKKAGVKLPAAITKAAPAKPAKPSTTPAKSTTTPVKPATIGNGKPSMEAPKKEGTIGNGKPSMEAPKKEGTIGNGKPKM